ncbi:MAG: FtsX-like permease family protein [Mariniblastus sp.]
MHLRLAAKLAWSNTTADWQRLLVRCSGIMFAVVLIFMQTGFRNALFDSNVRIMETKIEADIVIRSKSRFMLSSGQQMPLRHVTTARSCEGVQTAEPLYIENVASPIRRLGSSSRKIRVLAFEPNSEMFTEFGLANHAKQLANPNTAAADVKSKTMFGLPRSESELSDKAFGELAGKQIHIVALFESGINFSNDGNLVMTPANFANYFSFRGSGDPLSMVDYGVVHCQTDADINQTVARLKNMLGPNIIVQTRSDFLQSERDFWGTNTPIGLIFWFGTLIGFVVGLIICYQVLATDISDHMGEFATIKAMGYPPIFFGAVVVFQALLLSFVSFLPGFLIALVAFAGLNQLTGLVMFLDFERTSLVLGLTVAMCVISALIALRKLLSADPASLF